MITDFVTTPLRIIGADLLGSLILSAAIFVGSTVVFRLILHEQRWSACTRYRVTLLTFGMANSFTGACPGFWIKPVTGISSRPGGVRCWPYWA